MKALSYNLIKSAAAVGLVLGYLLYYFQGAEIPPSSPLTLLLIGTIGWLLAFKWPLIGNIFLLFAGAALLVHPFLHETSMLYSFTAILLIVTGLACISKWWKE